MPSVAIFRLAPELRCELRISGVNVLNIVRENWHVSAVINRKRKEQHFVEPDAKSREAAPDTSNDSVASRSGIPFTFVDRRNRYWQLRPTEKHIGKAASKFACRSVIVCWRILDIGANDCRKSHYESGREKGFHARATVTAGQQRAQDFILSLSLFFSSRSSKP
jgi:hypothetical protein